MKIDKLLAIAVLLADGLIPACSSTSGGKAADIAGPNAARPELTENELANTNYRIESLGEFRLDEGRFNRQYGEGLTERNQVTLEKIAFGDLEGDGLADAAVILAWQSGGSGTFSYLVAMRNTGNGPRQVDSVLLGDRVRISGLSIDGGEVRLEKSQAGPGDPAGSPSQQVKQTYSLQDGKWMPKTEKIAGSTAADTAKTQITGIVWKWERYEDTSEPRHFEIDDPDKYTLALFSDGSYQVRADCNRMQGRYTLQGRSISIVPGAATLAECGPESRYLEYLKDLTSAVNFGWRGDKLLLNLVLGGEILVFGNGGPVPDRSRH